MFSDIFFKLSDFTGVWRECHFSRGKEGGTLVTTFFYHVGPWDKWIELRSSDLEVGTFTY